MKRWQKVSENLGTSDAFLCLSYYNRRYLTNFHLCDGMVLVTRKKAYLIADFINILTAKNNPEKIETILMNKKWEDIISPLLEKHNIKKLGFEEEYVSVSKFEDMKDKLKNIEFVPFSKKMSIQWRKETLTPSVQV